MRKGVIIDLKNQYTYVLCKNAKIKRIKREYHHEVGQQIVLPLFSVANVAPIVVLTSLVLIIALLNPSQFLTPVNATSYVSLSVNPGLVLKVNQDYQITDVSYTNSDGQRLIQSVDFTQYSLEDSVVLFIDYCFENHYFTSNQFIDINVISDDSAQIKEVEERIQQVIDQYLNTHSTTITLSLDKVTTSQQNEAKMLGIPDSKIKLIDLILYYYPNFNKEALAKESVDDLVELLEDKGYEEELLDHLEDKLEDEEDDD